MKNKTLWMVFTAMKHILSWGLILGYTAIKYGAFVVSNGPVMVFSLISLLVFFIIMRHLKDQAQNGFGMYAKVAQSLRLFVPLILAFAIIILLGTNIANITVLLAIGVGANIAAIPFDIAAYYYGPNIVRDIGVNALVARSNEAERRRILEESMNE